MIPFLLIALPLNAFLILAAAAIVPGFGVNGLLAAFVLTVGLAGLNALFSAMLSVNDDDSFYRNVVRRLDGRLAPSEGLDEPGTVTVQIEGLVGMLGEAILECWQALRQRSEDLRQRIRRADLFALQRGAANIVLRDATTWAVTASMYRARRSIYCDYLGNDEVAHYAGPETRDAVHRRPPLRPRRDGDWRGTSLTVPPVSAASPRGG